MKALYSSGPLNDWLMSVIFFDLIPDMGPFFGWVWRRASHTHSMLVEWIGNHPSSHRALSVWPFGTKGLRKAQPAFPSQQWRGELSKPGLSRTCECPNSQRDMWKFLSFSACSLQIFFSRLQHSNLRGMVPLWNDYFLHLLQVRWVCTAWISRNCVCL